MVFITIDPYYDITFYNECKEALKNNGVSYKEYISTKAPYHYYFEVEQPPTFINYDKANESYTRFLVNIIKPLKPNDEYIYLRRDSYTELKAVRHYAINDALKTGAVSGEGIFFTSNKEDILRISKIFPRKIYFMGRYFNRKYKIFFTDNLMIKNFLNTDQILVQSKKFKDITELELELNYRVFRENDRLEKLSETPYVLNGSYYPVKGIRPDMTDMYVLS